MNYCPCCQDTLLCHISHNHMYWFCPTCWQEMPVSNLLNSHSLTEVVSHKFVKIHQKLEKPSPKASKSSVSLSELAIMQV